MTHTPLTSPLGKLAVKTNEQRPVIAFFVSEMEGDYSENLCKGLIDAAVEHDVNLLILPGKPIKSTYIRQFYINVIYEYVNSNNVNALILSSSTISNFISSREYTEFCLRYRPLPLVSIGMPIEGIPSVLINNRPGLQQLFRHLIQDHGKRRIAFMKGPEGHPEAEERFLVYRDSLKEHGLEFDPALVIPGDFTGYMVEQGIRMLLEERKVAFDAIAAANDEMAFNIIRELQNRNIRVPDDVCVTGFDNGRGARYFHPSLTTVSQPIFEQGRKALEIALELISSGQAPDAVLDTKMVLRESCGCLSETLQVFKLLMSEHRRQIQPKLIRSCGVADLFMAEVLPQLKFSALNMDLLKKFIITCFQEVIHPPLTDLVTSRLVRNFSGSINPNLFTDDDTEHIHKLLTHLHQWVNLCIKPWHKESIANFFQMLRAVVMDLAGKVQDARWNQHRLMIQNLRGLLMNIVTMIQNRDRNFSSLIPGLRSIGMESCYLYLYDQEIPYHENQVWHNPPVLNLVMAYQQGWELYSNPCRIPWEEVLHHQFLPKDRRYTMLLNPLFITNEQLGLLLCEVKPRDFLIFESLVYEISCTLKLSFMLHEREIIEQQLKAALEELGISNQKLNDISQTDELTGLYNRRGFFQLGAQCLELAGNTGKCGLLVFADMDGLKNINDTYGHTEGDHAIRGMASILTLTFTTANIIARIGGDEFAILVMDADQMLLSKFQDLITSLTAAFNQQSGKPYQLSFSIGAVCFQCVTGTCLETLISQADNLLYQQKRLKKSIEL